MSYKLRLLLFMERSHPVFNVAKLTTVSKDPIPDQHTLLSPDLIIIDREKEWEVKQILDSYQYYRIYWYLIKQNSFQLEANSWKNISSIFALEKVAEFYYLNPHTIWFIQAADFEQIKFRSIFLISSHSNQEGGMDVRGPKFLDFSLYLSKQSLSTPNLADFTFSYLTMSLNSATVRYSPHLVI